MGRRRFLALPSATCYRAAAFPGVRMPPNPAQTKTEKALAAKVKDLRTVEAERDMYPYLRDLLTQSTFGIGLRADQIVVDSPEASGRDSPDLAIYNTRGGKAIRTSDHVFAVFEVKRGSPLATHEAAIYEEKKKYVQPGTHYYSWCGVVDRPLARARI